MSTPHAIARAHAFCRILGSLYTDGTVSRDFVARLVLGHRIDAMLAAQDVELVTGTAPTIGEPHLDMNYYTVRYVTTAFDLLADLCFRSTYRGRLHVRSTHTRRSAFRSASASSRRTTSPRSSGQPRRPSRSCVSSSAASTAATAACQFRTSGIAAASPLSSSP